MHPVRLRRHTASKAFRLLGNAAMADPEPDAGLVIAVQGAGPVHIFRSIGRTNQSGVSGANQTEASARFMSLSFVWWADSLNA